ncbi:MAG: 2-hydroxyacyl-CoA dehydratase [Planctomycetota bacterium]|jgi:benzoyl-CoA reductase/2-hydroxyglutaryl-CoA dehydratase subunit BcrC/BadD/HgdB
MKTPPAQITLQEWASRYDSLKQQGLQERFYGGPLSRHVADGDTRLLHLKLDNSAAALGLWNFLLSENQRLHQYRSNGGKIIAAMKDLGTVPVMAGSLENLTTFYPDGAWWTPCIMEQNEGLFELAARYGLDESYCPVRAMIAAFMNEEHFPKPDAVISSTGAICDDFSAIAQRLEHLGFAIHWWEIPHRRKPDGNESAVTLPGGFTAPASQVRFVRQQLATVRKQLEKVAEQTVTDAMLSEGIRKANRFRQLLDRVRQLAYTAAIAPIGSLEMLIAEMLALHFCSDYTEAMIVLEDFLQEIEHRIAANTGIAPASAARVFWVNPVADLRAMNLLEDCGGRVCGTEYLFSHALDLIPEDIHPMEALAQIALADPMVGSTLDRAQRILRDIRRFGAEGVIISRIPGASHCAYEGKLIGAAIRNAIDLPVIEIEVPTLSDAAEPSIRTRMEALIETILQRRTS